MSAAWVSLKCADGYGDNVETGDAKLESLASTAYFSSADKARHRKKVAADRKVAKVAEARAMKHEDYKSCGCGHQWYNRCHARCIRCHAGEPRHRYGRERKKIMVVVSVMRLWAKKRIMVVV